MAIFVETTDGGLLNVEHIVKIHFTDRAEHPDWEEKHQQHPTVKRVCVTALTVAGDFETLLDTDSHSESTGLRAHFFQQQFARY